VKFVLPKIPAEEARRIISRRGLFFLRHKREVKKMELVHLPYYVHTVVVSQENGEREVLTCTDGISSGFSFFDASQLTFCDEASGMAFGFLVSAEESERACLESFRWHLVHRGLRFRVRASLKEIRSTERIYYPYWVGYFRTRRGYDFRAADAVTGEIQGPRMRKVFLTAFSQGAAPPLGLQREAHAAAAECSSPRAGR